MSVSATPPTGSVPDPAVASRYGEVYDRGYKHYDGPRLGRRHAFGALITYSIKRALGIKKSWTAKIIPIIVYVSAIIPIVVSIGIKAFFPAGTPIGYSGLMGLLFGVQGLFVATIAPEMLCGDRRENVLSLYFSRAIKRYDYLLAKLAATGILTLTISCLPAVIYWLGLQLLADHPLAALKDNAGDLGRIIVAGSLIALYLGALGLVVSSFTGRKSVAVAVIIVGFGITTGLALTLANVVTSLTVKQYVRFLSPADTVAALATRLFEPNVDYSSDSIWGQYLPLWQYAAGMVGIVVVCCAVMAWRYRPED